MDCGTPTESLLTIKILLNSILSTPVANILGFDLKYFYLYTTTNQPEFLRIKLINFLEDIIGHYKPQEKVDDKGFVYVKFVCGVYVLPHAGIIPQKLLEEQLKKHGYHQSDKTPGFWKHDTRPISFTLIVHDFRVNYDGKKHANRLINVLKENYTVEEDWEGEKYGGITLHWDCTKHKCICSCQNT